MHWSLPSIENQMPDGSTTHKRALARVIVEVSTRAA